MPLEQPLDGLGSWRKVCRFSKSLQSTANSKKEIPQKHPPTKHGRTHGNAWNSSSRAPSSALSISPSLSGSRPGAWRRACFDIALECEMFLENRCAKANLVRPSCRNLSVKCRLHNSSSPLKKKKQTSNSQQPGPYSLGQNLIRKAINL